jgi:hypothetical protein
VREKEVFSEADIYLSGETDPGLVIFSGKLRNGIDIRKAEEAVEEELFRLSAVPVTDAELEKARNRYESLRLISHLSASNKAFNLALHELLGDAEGINRERERYMSVTAGEMAVTAARTFLPSNCSIIHYIPKEQ